MTNMKEEEWNLKKEEFQILCEQIGPGFDLVRLTDKVISQLSIPQLETLREVARQKGERKGEDVLGDLERWLKLMVENPPEDIISAPIGGIWITKPNDSP